MALQLPTDSIEHFPTVAEHDFYQKANQVKVSGKLKEAGIAIINGSYIFLMFHLSFHKVYYIEKHRTSKPAFYEQCMLGSG